MSLGLCAPAAATPTQTAFQSLTSAGQTGAFTTPGAFGQWGIDFHTTGAATCQVEHYDPAAQQWEPIEVPDGSGGFVQLGYLVTTGATNIYVPGVTMAYGVQVRLNCLSVGSGSTVWGSWEN